MSPCIVYPCVAYPYLACLRLNELFEKNYGLKKNLCNIQDQYVMLQVSEIQREVKDREYGERRNRLNQEGVCSKME